MINSHRRIELLQWCLFAADTGLFFFFAWAGSLRKPNLALFPEQYALVYSILEASLYSFRAYQIQRSQPQAIAISTVIGLLVGGAVSTSLLMAFPVRINKSGFLTLFGGSLAGVPLLHYFFSWAGHVALPAERIIVIGSPEKWASLFREISNAVLRKLLPIAFITDANIERLQKLADTHSSAKTIIIADSAIAEKANIREFLAHAPKMGYSIRYLPILSEQTLMRVSLPVAREFDHYYDVLLNSVAPNTLKRVVDLFLAAACLVITSPILALVGILVLATSGRPVLYAQNRVGLNEHPFTIHKFRTMKNATDDAPSCFVDDAKDRITPIGRILRRTRLDELPQLWDVVIGTMSLIGPRPEQIGFHEQFSQEIPLYRERTRMRPGITGWAQINFAYASNRAQTARKLEYDLYYIINQSFLLDIQIFLKTIETVLGMRGSK